MAMYKMKLATLGSFTSRSDFYAKYVTRPRSR